MDGRDEGNEAAFIIAARGKSHKTRRCRGVTYPESYITEYATYTKTTSVSFTKVPCWLRYTSHSSGKQPEIGAIKPTALGRCWHSCTREISMFSRTGRGSDIQKRHSIILMLPQYSSQCV